MDITIGCDPELFVKNPNSGKFVSGHGLIPGTKAKPFKVEDGAIQVDGMALEININPAKTKEEFRSRIRNVQRQMQDMIPGHQLAVTPTALYDKDIWEATPKEAKMLGCDPDFNAYDEGRPFVMPHVDRPWRTAGGHIHFGWGKDFDITDHNHLMDCCDLAKQCDFYLGIYSLQWDPDAERRALYGKAGCFRPKPYGMEYRTLSNMWLESDELIEWVFYAAAKAAHDLKAGQCMNDMRPGIARNIIDTNNVNWRLRYGNMGQNLLPPPVRKAA